MGEDFSTAQLLVRHGQHAQALKYINNAIKENNKDLGAYLLGAKCLFVTGNKLKAKRALEAALEIDTQNTTAITMLADLYYSQKNYDFAKETVEKLLTIAVSDRGYELLGDISFKRKDYAGAIKSYEKALSINPKNTNIMFKVAGIHFINKDYKKCIIYCTVINDFDKTHKDTQRLYHRALSKYKKLLLIQNKNFSFFQKLFYRVFSFIYDPMIHNQLSFETEVSVIIKDMEKKSEKNKIDGLTKLFNRNYYDEYTRTIFNDGTIKNIALCVIDIDNFKRVNDTYGHGTGDLVLARVGSLFKSTVEKSGLAAAHAFRYGGEELVMIATNSSYNDVVKTIEQVREAIQTKTTSYLNTDKINLEKKLENDITVSIGVAEYPDNAKTYSELFKIADECLYNSKRTGKNRVTIYGESVKNEINKVLKSN